MSGFRDRLGRVQTETWLRLALGGGTLLVVLVATIVWGPDPEEVATRLEDKYGVDEVFWDQGWSKRRSDLVVDGRDLSDDCTVDGTWGSLDDVEIVCTRDVGIGRVEAP
ncbi:hypothetical protein [Nocardioides euryhalodurans]|uniref:Uncharacterized protein n=1 Tax=Nocardioides euryhalodurans TaxID=2518370 RepID=A0A4V1BDY0_9ACTN|nr:hypothetical protein [Nocardioides euryhalodurans]QBR92692.1 hypothetical protein EXE57_10700 [Nocardioides euryhalodurans]